MKYEGKKCFEIQENDAGTEAYEDQYVHWLQGGLYRMEAVASELLAACKALFDADHYDHFAARMSDSEMDAIRQIEAAIARAEGE